MWESCLFCLGGDTLIVYDSGKYKYVLVLKGRVSLHICCFLVFLFIFPHMRLCVLFSISGNIQVDSIELLSTFATDG